MNFQKFIYDFLKFNDFSANFHDKNTRVEALKSCAMGIWYIFGVVWCKKVGLSRRRDKSAEPAEPHKTVLRTAQNRWAI